MRTILSILTPAALLAAVATAQPTELQRRRVRELYGAAINRAVATRDAQDDVQLAAELLDQARNDQLEEPLRVALAYAAIDLAAEVGSAEGADLAGEAVETLAGLTRLRDVERLRIAKQIALARLTRAAERAVPRDQRAELAAEAVDAMLAYAEQVGRRTDPVALRAQLLQAQRYARMFGLDEQNDQLVERIRQVSQAIAYQRRLAEAQAELEAARRSGDYEALNRARVRTALLHLQYDGDVAAAGAIMARADHPQAPGLAAAAEYIADADSLEPEQMLPTARTLAAAAEPLDPEPRKRVALVGVDIVQRFLATDPEPFAQRQAQSLLETLNELAGQGPRDRLLAAIEETYGPIHGQLTILDAESRRVRLQWSFGLSRQGEDWPGAGDWRVSHGRLVGEGSGADPAAEAHCKLVFDAGAPLSFAYEVAGDVYCNAGLQTSDRAPFEPSRRGAYRFLICSGARGTALGIVGPTGPNRLTNNVRPRPDATYRCRAQWGGQGDLRWVVNGQSVTFRSNEEAALGRYLRPALSTAAGPTAYDDITVEGVLVVGAAGADAP